MASSKAVEFPLITAANRAYQGGATEVHSLVDLIRLRLEDRKNSLVKAPPLAFQALQGECNALQELFEDITIPKTIKGKDQ
jgi:hypothetical protein